MIQIAKIIGKIPYLVRDKYNDFKDESYIEELLSEINKHDVQNKDIINIFSNNRDNLLHFHLVIKSNIPKESLVINFKNEKVELTFEEYRESKTKTKYINSFMFIETFKHLNENELVNVFDEMIGCNGKNLFIGIPKENLKLFNPTSKHYLLRKVLLDKEETINDVAQSFGIETSVLFEELNPNLIKNVCKDLNLTYKTLASELGYKPDTINKAASTGKVSEQLNKAIELYLENLRLKDELRNFNLIRQTLQNISI